MIALVTNVELADDGASYSITVRNGGGSTTSSSAVLTVSSAPTPPSVTTQPQAVTVNVGQTATFGVEAQGTAPLRFQWQKDGADVSGATAASFTTAATTLVDSGSTFTVRVSNGAGEARSEAAGLTVLPPGPVITQQPAALAVLSGQPASFVLMASGQGTLSYQWSRNGVPVAGATQATFTLATTVLSDDGAAFTATVTNAGGSITSNVASLSVVAPAVPPSIATQPQGQSVTVGQTATFGVAVTGTPPFTYQWQRNGAAIAGATGATYTTAPTQLTDNGSLFRLVVGNGTSQSANSDIAALTVRAVGPSVTAQPQDTTVLVGRPASFGITATGTAPVRYQWRRNGVDLTGETGPSLTLQRTVLSDHEASFSVVVSDAQGSVLSNSARLAVTPIAVQDLSGAQRGLLSRNADGSVWAVYGAPGVNTGGNPPTLVPLLLRDASGFVITGYEQVSAGRVHALAVDASGGAWAWGSTNCCTLGDAVAGSHTAYTPVRVTEAPGTPLVGVRSVQASSQASHALMLDGSKRSGNPSFA